MRIVEFTALPSFRKNKWMRIRKNYEPKLNRLFGLKHATLIKEMLK